MAEVLGVHESHLPGELEGDSGIKWFLTTQIFGRDMSEAGQVVKGNS